MTVADKFKGLLASLKSAQADLELFAVDTNNQEAKDLYNSCASQTQNVIRSLEQRWQKVQEEEPQYRA
jgi:hypothetical protein